MGEMDEFVVLWRLRGHGRDVRCLRQRTRSGLELRVLWGDQLFLTENFKDEAALVKRAEEFRETLEARGWATTMSLTGPSVACNADSAGGQGTRRLPADPEPPRLDAGRAGRPDIRRPAVLVVDDESDIRQFLRGYLEASGYAVSEAADIDAALNALEQGPVDAVVLDVRMPDRRGWGRTGLEVLTFIRLHARLAAVPVMVMATSDLGQEEQALVKRCRAELFTKPGGYDLLLHHLDRATGVGGARRS